MFVCCCFPLADPVKLFESRPKQNIKGFKAEDDEKLVLTRTRKSAKTVLIYLLFGEMNNCCDPDSGYARTVSGCVCAD